MAIPDGTQTNNVYILEFMNQVSSAVYDSGFQVTNTTGNPGTCNITFPSYPTANVTGYSLPGNATISFFAPNFGSAYGPAALPVGFDNSVLVSCTQSVVGMYNYSSRSGSYYGDTVGTVNLLNK